MTIKKELNEAEDIVGLEDGSEKTVRCLTVMDRRKSRGLVVGTH